MNKQSKRFDINAALQVLSFILIVLMTSPAILAQTGKTPYDKERLLKVVKLNALSTEEIVQAVEQRGVNFQTNPTVESEFRGAGARPELIEALRRNYRAPSSGPTVKTPPAAQPPRGSAAVPAGPPLSKQEIVTMLQGGLPATRVEQFVEVRGVNFAVTPEISREITAAGGNRSLLGAITEKAPGTGVPSGSVQPPATGRHGPDYDDLTDQAVAAMDANNPAYAIRLLQQAAVMDSARPTAFQLLGFVQLYGNKDIFSAERSMRAALERGGAAAFRVYHDHDGLFTSYCQGSFFVTKTGVTFKADDGNHTFEAADQIVKSTSINDFVGSQYGAFNVKVFQDATRKKTKTYNFAPATTKKVESTLVLNLIKSY